MKPLSIWVLTAAIGVLGANSLVLSPIATDVAQSWAGISATDVLMASAGYGLGTAASALTLALRVDVFGLKRALVLALGVLVTMLLVSALAPHVAVLITAQVVAGLAAGVALPATYGLAADLAPKGREAETLGKVLVGWTLSLVAGVSLGAFVADVLGWRIVFIALAVIAAGAIGFILRAQDNRPPKTSEILSPFRALKIPGLPPLLMNVLCYMAAFYGLYAYLGTHMIQVLGTSTTIAGFAALSYGIGFGIVAPLDRLIDRFGAQRAAFWAFALLAMTYVLVMLSSGNVTALLIVCFIWGMMNHLGLNIMVGQLTALDPTRRAAIMGLYTAITYGAVFVGTAAFRPVFETYGFATSAVISAIFILPAALRSWWARR